MSSSHVESRPSATGNGLWNTVKKQSQMAGKRASHVAQQTKIRAEMMMIDQRMTKRKQRFGVELYDTLVLPADQDPTFIIESETLENIRGHFVTIFKDNKALLQKRATQQQLLVEVEERKEFAYPKVPCDTFGGQMKNAGKAANFLAEETMCKSKIAAIEKDMKNNKKKFGLEVYRLLAHLEDHQKWLSPDRDVRFLYDSARRDVSKMLAEKQQKELDLNAVGSPM